jgi:hypothetical protein
MSRRRIRYFNPAVLVWTKTGRFREFTRFYGRFLFAKTHLSYRGRGRRPCPLPLRPYFLIATAPGLAVGWTLARPTPDSIGFALPVAGCYARYSKPTFLSPPSEGDFL